MTASELVRIAGVEIGAKLAMIGGRLPTMNAFSEELRRMRVLKLYGEGHATAVVAERTGLAEDSCRNIREKAE